MTLWLRVTLLGFCLAAAASVAWGQKPEGWDRYLDGYRGPYRGQVIDADTRAPLVGAVFVALWRRDRVYPFQVNSENYAVREVVTDQDGRFRLDARDVEDGAPKRTHRPEFLIFHPGYGSFPRFQRAPKGFIGGVFEKDGAIVELPRLDEREERRKHLFTFGPRDFSEDPFRDLPQLMRALNAEKTAIGMTPYSPREKH